MKKLQMSKLNIKNSTKNSNHPTSHLSLHTSQGITLMSLVIYITIMFVVLAIIMRVTTYYTKNINDAVDISLETQLEKLNLYMLEETKKTDNLIIAVSENSITFSDEKSFVFKDENEDGIGEIYYNNIKLCENIQECKFSITDDNMIKITIKINDIFKNLNYTLTKQTTYTQDITEDTYIINKVTD